MEIEDAFTAEAIELAGTNAGEDEEHLRFLVQQIYTTNELEPPSNDAVNVAVLFWVAGRTYQSDQVPPDVRIPIWHTPDELQDYIAFLKQRGEG